MTDPRELKGSGLKVTLPRLRVLDLFQHSPDRHLTAEDVYRKGSEAFTTAFCVAALDGLSKPAA